MMLPSGATSGGGLQRLPTSDPKVPLSNLSLLGRRMDALRCFLAESLDCHADIGGHKLLEVSSEIASVLRQIVLNGAALLSLSQVAPTAQAQAQAQTAAICPAQAEGPDQAKSLGGSVERSEEHKDSSAAVDDRDGGDYEVVEMDAVELLADHVHFCEICGKGFKRDANLRMHMRAHGSQFKTLQALTKPELRREAKKARRFSCPFPGCNRNRSHRRFRPLKSAVCVKSHFRRSHCPKIYPCTRCHKKSFSVMTDLKSHLKHCGERRWCCSCGTSFFRKDKLFGHLALFEGHMPALSKMGGEGQEAELENGEGGPNARMDPEFFEDLLLDGLETVDRAAWMDF